LLFSPSFKLTSAVVVKDPTNTCKDWKGHFYSADLVTIREALQQPLLLAATGIEDYGRAEPVVHPRVFSQCYVAFASMNAGRGLFSSSTIYANQPICELAAPQSTPAEYTRRCTSIEHVYADMKNFSSFVLTRFNNQT
jgi:hypothetical protein